MDDEQLKALHEEIARLAHAMQSGVATEIAHDMNNAAATPKHLRVGVNSAMVEHGALVKLLIDKGVIDLGEYVVELRDAMKREVEMYERRLSERIGAHITLG